MLGWHQTPEHVVRSLSVVNHLEACERRGQEKGGRGHNRGRETEERERENNGGIGGRGGRKTITQVTMKRKFIIKKQLCLTETRTLTTVMILPS